jgi:leucyl aminopeptidase (aminopeptidase T)
VPDADLNRAIRAVVRDCLAVKDGEDVIVVCNPATQHMGELLREEAAGAGADPVLAVMSERASHAAEPPATVADAMAAADVVLAPTVQSLSHTAARKRATENGARAATLPGVTEDMLARVMSADMEGLRLKGDAVAEALDRAAEGRITDANGTDLRLDLSPGGDPRRRRSHRAGAFGNLPCGEAFISPAGGEGALVIDGSLAGIGLVDHPVELVVEGH